MKPIWVMLALAAGLALQAEETSETNPRLKRALERFPAADANKDGVLTLSEAQAYRDKHQGSAQAKAAPAKAPKGGERHVYKKVGDVALPLYVFKPEGHKPEAKAPAIVFFFGGAWTTGSPEQFEPYCRDLASRGMVTVTVEYRVSSRHPVKVEDCIEDAKSAMRWVRGNALKLGIDPNRIASGGGSAGGHLAACLAVIDDFNADSDDLEVNTKPNAMVLFNPALGGIAASVVGKRTRGPVEKAFPLTYASKKQPACIMFFGTNDALLEGAQRYRKASVEAGNDCKIVTYEGQGHGFFNHGRSGGKYYNLTLTETDRFLVKLGWLSSKK